MDDYDKIRDISPSENGDKIEIGEGETEYVNSDAWTAYPLQRIGSDLYIMPVEGIVPGKGGECFLVNAQSLDEHTNGFLEPNERMFPDWKAEVYGLDSDFSSTTEVRFRDFDAYADDRREVRHIEGTSNGESMGDFLSGESGVNVVYRCPTNVAGDLAPELLDEKLGVRRIRESELTTGSSDPLRNM
jgi:hypothetical protein